MRIAAFKLIFINKNTKNYKFGKARLSKCGNFQKQQPVVTNYSQINFRPTRKVQRCYWRSKSAWALPLLSLLLLLLLLFVFVCFFVCILVCFSYLFVVVVVVVFLEYFCQLKLFSKISDKEFKESDFSRPPLICGN